MFRNLRGLEALLAKILFFVGEEPGYLQTALARPSCSLGPSPGDQGRLCPRPLGSCRSQQVPKEAAWGETPWHPSSQGPFLRTQASAQGALPPHVCLLIWCDCVPLAPLAAQSLHFGDQGLGWFPPWSWFSPAPCSEPCLLQDFGSGCTFRDLLPNKQPRPALLTQPPPACFPYVEGQSVCLCGWVFLLFFHAAVLHPENE